MKLLFVQHDISRKKGIFLKVLGILNAIHDLNSAHEIILLIHGSKINEDPYKSFKVKVEFLELSSFKSNRLLNFPLLWPLLYEKTSKLFFNQLHTEVFRIKPDIIVLRDSQMSVAGIRFLSKCSEVSKIYLESNTDLRSELEMNARTKGSWYGVELDAEKKNRRKVHELVKGVIAVTEELKQLAAANGFEEASIKVISNGVQIDEDIACKPPTFKKILKGVFFAGTSSVWNGLDRLSESLNSYRGDVRLVIDVYGVEGENGRFKCAEINYLKAVDSTKFKSVLSEYHFGISTLALYRKKMNEASALKVREYLKYGLPILLAYDDTDVNSNEPFVFKVSNDNESIDFQKLVVWYSRLSKNEGFCREICQFAAERLSFANKAKEMLNFLVE